MAINAALKENGYGDRVRIKTGKVRLSFPRLFEKDNKSEKYQATLIIPKKSDTNNVLQKAVENAKLDGKTRLWGGRIPGKMEVWIIDGDEPDANGETRPEYEGCVIINAKSNTPPPVFDTDGSTIDGADIYAKETIYAGCYVQAIVDAYPYNNSSAGIAFALCGMKKLTDGERLSSGGYKPEADDFDAADEEEDFL